MIIQVMTLTGVRGFIVISAQFAVHLLIFGHCHQHPSL